MQSCKTPPGTCAPRGRGWRPAPRCRSVSQTDACMPPPPPLTSSNRSPARPRPHPTRTPMTDDTMTAAQAVEESLSYEAAREELVTVVHRLEAGGTTLEESLALWERGEKLARTCQGWLDGARERRESALESAASCAAGAVGRAGCRGRGGWYV